ncbi:late competence protein ComER [Halalkalibacillus sediminis]|uniref:Late competence protein ComER n=1 Tax=Halalkalibacillus sediminis TaxID=2018042 RepID=A0A2I0QXK7_9BACI|nr:late competence protein ComER [Halalkalibacillus sediminis]PKR79055.1 late competence protein ComER [Halalkalibacillus sediminis]
MKWGIIGTGNMGKVWLHALSSSKSVSEKNIFLYNRSFLKAYELKNDYPDVHIVQAMDTVIRECDIILLCAKPKDIIDIAKKLKDKINEDQCVISITSSILVDQLGAILHHNTARIIPSITNRALSGATLVTFNENMDDGFKEILWDCCSEFSTPIEISDEHVRISSDIVSCGPAFISFILESMIEAAVKQTGLPKEEASKMAETMIIGYGKLLDENIYTFSTLKEKVMVKGGITGEGMKALEGTFQNIFEPVFESTHLKFDSEKKIIGEMVQKIHSES